MVNPAEDVCEENRCTKPGPVSEDERPELPMEIYEKLLDLPTCMTHGHCSNCDRCEY